MRNSQHINNANIQNQIALEAISCSMLEKANDELEFVNAKINALEQGILQCKKIEESATTAAVVKRACRAQNHRLMLRKAQLIANLATVKQQVDQAKQKIAREIVRNISTAVN